MPLDSVMCKWPWESRIQGDRFLASIRKIFLVIFCLFWKAQASTKCKSLKPTIGNESSQGPQLFKSKVSLATLHILVAICGNGMLFIMFSKTYLVPFNCLYLGSSRLRRSVIMNMFLKLSMWSERADKRLIVFSIFIRYLSAFSFSFFTGPYLLKLQISPGIYTLAIVLLSSSFVFLIIRISCLVSQSSNM